MAATAHAQPVRSPTSCTGGTACWSRRPSADLPRICRGRIYQEEAHRLMIEPADGGFPVAVPLRVLNVSHQPYYRWLKHHVTRSSPVGVNCANVLFNSHREDPGFASRLLTADARGACEEIGESIAWRICRDNQGWSVFDRKRGKSGKRLGPLVLDEHLKREFTG